MTTATPLADPDVLNGAPVTTRGASRAPDPLSVLLAQVGSSTRGATPATPATWAIQRLTITSVPAGRWPPRAATLVASKRTPDISRRVTISRQDAGFAIG